MDSARLRSGHETLAELFATVGGFATLCMQPSAVSVRFIRHRGNPVSRKPKTKKPATVRKIIKPYAPGVSEKAENSIHDADDLYKEIRIENTLEDSKGHKVKLKQGAEVELTSKPIRKTQPESTSSVL